MRGVHGTGGAQRRRCRTGGSLIIISRVWVPIAMTNVNFRLDEDSQLGGNRKVGRQLAPGDKLMLVMATLAWSAHLLRACVARKQR